MLFHEPKPSPSSPASYPTSPTFQEHSSLWPLFSVNPSKPASFTLHSPLVHGIPTTSSQKGLVHKKGRKCGIKQGDPRVNAVGLTFVRWTSPFDTPCASLVSVENILSQATSGGVLCSWWSCQVPFWRLLFGWQVFYGACETNTLTWRLTINLYLIISHWQFLAQVETGVLRQIAEVHSCRRTKIDESSVILWRLGGWVGSRSESSPRGREAVRTCDVSARFRRLARNQPIETVDLTNVISLAMHCKLKPVCPRTFCLVLQSPTIRVLGSFTTGTDQKQKRHSNRSHIFSDRTSLRQPQLRCRLCELDSFAPKQENRRRFNISIQRYGRPRGSYESSRISRLVGLGNHFHPGYEPIARQTYDEFSQFELTRSPRTFDRSDRMFHRWVNA